MAQHGSAGMRDEEGDLCDAWIVVLPRRTCLLNFSDYSTFDAIVQPKLNHRLLGLGAVKDEGLSSLFQYHYCGDRHRRR